jgi:hypothetical protein
MREEKSKLDADRYSKECEMLKWKWREEAAAWKTKEQEVRFRPFFSLSVVYTRLRA